MQYLLNYARNIGPVCSPVKAVTNPFELVTKCARKDLSFTPAQPAILTSHHCVQCKTIQLLNRFKSRTVLDLELVRVSISTDPYFCKYPKYPAFWTKLHGKRFCCAQFCVSRFAFSFYLIVFLFGSFYLFVFMV